MKSNHIYYCFAILAIAGFNGPAVAQETAKAENIVVCPPEISNFRLNYTTKYTPPTGWGHADASSRAKKGGVYTGLTLVVKSHGMQKNRMICSYASGARESHLKLASIKRIAPKGTECRAISDYRFSCVTRSE